MLCLRALRYCILLTASSAGGGQALCQAHASRQEAESYSVDHSACGARCASRAANEPLYSCLLQQWRCVDMVKRERVAD